MCPRSEKGTYDKAEQDPRIIIKEIFNKSLLASDPYKAVIVFGYNSLLVQEWQFRQTGPYRVRQSGIAHVKGIEEESAGDLPLGGIIVTKYGHSVERDRNSKIITYEAGHPLPDENGLRATHEIMGLVKGSDKETIFIFLISGGGSALLVAPFGDVTLADKQKTTALLLKAGADIYEMNTIRKHISAVKGGRLAEAAYPAAIISLILSDVMGDRLDMIASGPTAPDKTTYTDAFNVIRNISWNTDCRKALRE